MSVQSATSTGMAEGTDSIFNHPWLQGHRYTQRQYLPRSLLLIPPLLLGLLAIPQLPVPLTSQQPVTPLTPQKPVTPPTPQQPVTSLHQSLFGLYSAKSSLFCQSGFKHGMKRAMICLTQVFVLVRTAPS